MKSNYMFICLNSNIFIAATFSTPSNMATLKQHGSPRSASGRRVSLSWQKSWPVARGWEIHWEVAEKHGNDHNEIIIIIIIIIIIRL